MTDTHRPGLLCRVPRTRAQTRANYDRLSRWYPLISASETPFRRLGLKLLAAQPGERVLEVGFGPGTSLAVIGGQVGPGGRAVGIDLSWGMARKADAALRRLCLRQRCVGGMVSLHLGDAAVMPYPDGYFDALFSAFVIELFDTPELLPVLCECRRTLRPGGRACLVSLARPTQAGGMVRLYEWFHLTFPALIDCRPIPLAALLEQAGFAIQEVREGSMWGLPVSVVLGKVA